MRSDGFDHRVLELRLGVNRFGRTSDNDFQIEHPSISATHCEIELTGGHVVVRDCDSTNGTFLGGNQIKEERLYDGQTLCLGDVELFVESTDVTIAIPKFDPPKPSAPPVVLTDGSLLCPRHPRAKVTHQCIHCREVMCDACVTRLRRRGGKVLKLCPLCSHKCEPLVADSKKKKSLLGFLHRTVKLPLLIGKKDKD